MSKYGKAYLAFCPMIYRLLMFVGLPLLAFGLLLLEFLAGGDFSDSFYATMIQVVLLFYMAEAWADGIIFGNFSGASKITFFNYFLSSKNCVETLTNAVVGDCVRRFYMCLYFTALEIPHVIGSFYHKKSVDMLFMEYKLDEFHQSMEFCILLLGMMLFAMFAIITLVIWISRYFALIWFGMLFASLGGVLLEAVMILATVNVLCGFGLSLIAAILLNKLFQKSVIKKGVGCYYDN